MTRADRAVDCVISWICVAFAGLLALGQLIRAHRAAVLLGGTIGVIVIIDIFCGP